MDTILSVAHFPDVCRFCLVYASQENPQLSLASHSGQPTGCRWAMPSETLAQIGVSCFGLKIDPDDRLPFNICLACKNALIVANTFRNRCIRAYDILLEVQNKDGQNEFQLKIEGSEPGANPKRLKPEPSSDEEVEAKPVQTVRVADDEDEDRRSASAEQPDEDSDDEYERDLADKYESLDQTYHIEAPNATGSAEAAPNTSTAKPPDAAGNPDAGLKKPATVPRKRLAAADELSDKLKNQCYICGLIVKRMRQHMSCHPGELQFKCELCPRFYLTKTGRDRHIQRQHPERRFTIDPNGTVVHVNRASQKQLQQRLRYAGKEFIHRNGLVQSARRMRAGCDPRQCRFKCTERLAAAHRQRAFDEYYALADLRKQWQYLSLLCDRTVPKMPVRQRAQSQRRPQRRRQSEDEEDEEEDEQAEMAEAGKDEAKERQETETTVKVVKKVRKMRQNNVRYFLYGDIGQIDDGQKAAVDVTPVRDRIFVCNTMFLATFDIRYGSLATALQKTDVSGNLIDIDRRGRTRNVN